MRVVIRKKQWGIVLILGGEALLCLERERSTIYRYLFRGLPGIRKDGRVIKDEE